MKRVALVFVIAVLLPCLILAWLAVRSLRDQDVIFERQQSLLYQGVTDSLARGVEARFSERQHEFVIQVERMLSQQTVNEVAATFDSRLCADWPAAKVGFAITANGALLSPSPTGRPEVRAFCTDNGKFLTGTEKAEIYFNPKQQVQTISPPNTSLDAGYQGTGSSLSEKKRAPQKGYALNSSSTPSTRNVIPTSEWNRNYQAVDEPQVQQAQASKLASAEGEFQQLISDISEGTLARFVDNKLVILFWYRAARDPRYIFGAQLDLARLQDELRDLLPGSETALHDEICVAIIDDRGRPVARSHPGFEADWKHPFVATEIGEILPHWEITAYLLKPEQLVRTVQTTRLVIGLFIGVLVLAIAVGGWLIARDINRQLTLARQKTDFVSNVSHELKTPLTSIRMFSELLSDGRVNEPAKQRSYLNIITAEAARLTRLINNVLDFSRMERGEKEYNFAECDLAVIARETAETFRPHLESAGFRFDTTLPESPVKIRADRDAVAQVIVNLLSNAEKYSNGAKEIALQVACHAEPVPWAELKVLDLGPGVPRGCGEKIFEKFFRANDSLTNSVQGSGLGLTLARQIARAHGGDVVYAPREGGGSCFTLRLPLTGQTT